VVMSSLITGGKFLDDAVLGVMFVYSFCMPLLDHLSLLCLDVFL
jgi:hypothetical protein